MHDPSTDAVFMELQQLKTQLLTLDVVVAWWRGWSGAVSHMVDAFANVFGCGVAFDRGHAPRMWLGSLHVQHTCARLQFVRAHP